MDQLRISGKSALSMIFAASGSCEAGASAPFLFFSATIKKRGDTPHNKRVEVSSDIVVRVRRVRRGWVRLEPAPGASVFLRRVESSPRRRQPNVQVGRDVATLVHKLLGEPCEIRVSSLQREHRQLRMRRERPRGSARSQAHYNFTKTSASIPRAPETHKKQLKRTRS